jgi:hypothetical protein
MLKNNKLLIDQDCPMCASYGSGFTKLKMIDAQTVRPYQQADEALAHQIDMNRARSEIALYDETTAQTVYGIDAMIAIVTHGVPWLKRLFHRRWLYVPLSTLYRFISYNRKVIYPAASQPGLRDCTPPLHRAYRWLYILLVALFTGLILNRYAALMVAEWGLAPSLWREYAVCLGQVLWQGAVILAVDPKKSLAYLGNMSTVSLGGAILLLPPLLLTAWVSVPPLVLLGYFALVVSCMLLEHLRRCRLLGLPLAMTASWVTFRTVVLGLIVISIL